MPAEIPQDDRPSLLSAKSQPTSTSSARDRPAGKVCRRVIRRIPGVSLVPAQAHAVKADLRLLCRLVLEKGGCSTLP